MADYSMEIDVWLMVPYRACNVNKDIKHSSFTKKKLTSKERLYNANLCLQ